MRPGGKLVPVEEYWFLQAAQQLKLEDTTTTKHGPTPRQEEPQPANVKEGIDPADVLPANAEDRKAAQALSSLDAKVDDDTSKKQVDLKALNDAMSRLDTSSQVKQAAAVKKEEPKKLVKVDQADVALLVEHLDIGRVKALELLRAHDANAVEAMSSWMTTA